MYALSTNPETQKALRAEINTVPTDSPTYDELNALPYLDAVVRETLRLYTPIIGTVRVPVEDSVIPFGDPIIDRNGVKHSELLCVSGTASRLLITPFLLLFVVWRRQMMEPSARSVSTT